MSGSASGALERPARTLTRRRASVALDRLLGRVAGPGLLVLCLASSQVALAAEIPYEQFIQTRPLIENASPNARQVAAWVIRTDDNQGLPFLIVDKVNAQALAFDRRGLLIGVAPALLGLAKGDDSLPGVGDRPLSGISPDERITPAGRFVAVLGKNLNGKGILWLDYDAAISLHPVITGSAADRRQHRLTTTTAGDNRISYGCINVPAVFYETIVGPLFRSTVGIVYVLPEVRSIETVFFAPPVSD